MYAGEKPREEQPHACGRRVLRAGGEKYQQRARSGVVKIADDGGVGGVEELLYDAAERYGKREQLRILNSVLVVHIIDI